MRKTIKELNTEWQVRKDLDNRGVKEDWYRDFGESSKTFDINIPWQTYGEDFIDYTGYLWYFKTFELEPNQFELSKDNIILEFSAVDYKSDVWLNGNYLGSNEGGYTPFSFKVNDYINLNSKNNLTVRVYDPRDNSEIPRGKQGSWYTRVSGIWQEVTLKKYGPNYFKNIFITPDIDEEKITLDMALAKEDSSSKYEVVATIFSPLDSEKILKKESFNYGSEKSQQISLNSPLLWSPENPNLYDIKLELFSGDNLIDEYKTHFGMRKIEARGNKLFLNNKPLYMRGALDQGFWPETIYRAKTEEMIKDEIRKAKKMGFNLLRKHIKTPDPEYLYWADKMGILIWQEAPNYSTWNLQARERFKDEYIKMVRRDYNHPSIIIWSIYNEEWGLEWDLRNDAEKQLWLESFFDFAKKLDPTRLICDNSGWAHVKTDLNDYHEYYAVPENYKEWQEKLDEIESYPDKNYVDNYSYKGEPKLISEFGIWGLPEYSLIEKEYKKTPPWFKGSAELFDEEFKIPATFKNNFDKYDLNQIFSDFDELARATQKRQLIGFKDLIEEMRKRQDISGYVITELIDVEWETNGFLDYFRNYKLDPDLVNEFNGEITLIINLNKRNFWSEETVATEFIIINNCNEKIAGSLKVKIEDLNQEKSLEVNLEPNSINKFNSLKFELPETKDNKLFSVSAELKRDNAKMITNREQITVTSKETVKNNPVNINPFQLNTEFIQELKKNGYLISEESDIWLTSELSDPVLQHIWQGGNAVFLAEKGDLIAEKGLINFKTFSTEEDWDNASSYQYVDKNFFSTNFINKISCWEFADIYPEYYIENLDDLNWERIMLGRFYGWIGNVTAGIMELSYGKGRLIVSTVKTLDEYNHHPVSTIILNRLINYLG